MKYYLKVVQNILCMIDVIVQKWHLEKPGEQHSESELVDVQVCQGTKMHT